MSSPDTFWENLKRKLQRRFPWIHKLDDVDWKTWILHAVVTLAAGQFFGALIAFTLKAPLHDGVVGGTWGMVGWYIVREINVRVEEGWHYKKLDGVMDVLGPILVALARTLWL